MSNLWISSADGIAANMRKAFDDTFGCIADGFVLYTGAGYNAVNNNFRLFGIDPVPARSPVWFKTHADNTVGALISKGFDGYTQTDDGVSPYFVAYSPNNNIDGTSASWRYFL